MPAADAFAGMPAEFRLLLALLRGTAAAVPGDLDWGRFLRLVDHHRVALRLEHDGAALPPEVAAALTRDRRDAAARSLLQAAELARVARLLDGAGLSWMALKGPAFGRLLHGAAGRRGARDLDILVRPEGAPAARALLLSAGYAPAAHQPAGFHEGLVHAGAGILLELHTDLFDEPRLFPLSLFRPFEHAATAEVAGTPVRTLALEPALVYAAVHGAKHFWRRLFWLLDIADAARAERVDWPAVLALARRMGVERQVAGALVLARRLLDAPLPAALAADSSLMRAGERTAAFIGRLADRPLLRDEEEAYYAAGRFRTLRWMLDIHTRADARRAVLAQVLAPSDKDRAAVALPGWLASGYLVVRPVRLLVEALTRMGRHVRR